MEQGATQLGAYFMEYIVRVISMDMDSITLDATSHLYMS